MDGIDFGLSDGDYWDAPQSRNMAIAQQLWALDRDVLAVGTPRMVPLDQRDSLPVLVHRAGTYRELMAVSFLERTAVVAVDTQRNLVYVTGVLQEPDVELPSGPVDPASIPEGQTTASAILDLREACELEWRPTRLLVTAILRDIVSNRAAVELGRTLDGYEDPEVKKFIEEHRARLAGPAVHPPAGEPFPAYHTDAQAPRPPAQRGLRIATERTVLLTPGARSVLRGSFRLPVHDHERVRRAADAAPDDGGRPAADAAPDDAGVPRAVIGITLVITASDDDSVGVLRLDVPSYDAPAADDGDATGAFAIDLLEVGVVPRRAQTYFVYAFSGEYMVGPVPAALVSEDMIGGPNRGL